MTSPTKRQAFTLVEILMVLAILGITTVVSMPYLVKSIRGNRLRVAGGTVVKAGRYARTMALLHTREMKLILEIDAARLRVEPRYEVMPTKTADGVSPSADAGNPRVTVSPPGEGEPPPPVPSNPRLNISRELDAVRIDYVEPEHGPRETQGTVTVIYHTNGRCTPYEVRLRDEQGNAMVVTVDALSSAEARREDR